MDQRLTAKELAPLLRKHVSYVYGMKRQGFPMPRRTATLAEAIEWLERHPRPRARTCRRISIRVDSVEQAFKRRCLD